MNAKRIVSFAALSIVTAACGDAGKGAATAPDHSGDAPSVAEARVAFPRFLELQSGVISSTCSPNPGVCHNSSNYPDMSTAGGTLANVGGPCNMEIPDPLQGWDGCERPADRLKAGGLDVRLAYLVNEGPGTWALGLESAAQTTQTVTPVIASSDGIDMIGAEWELQVSLTAGSEEAVLRVPGADDVELMDGILASVTGGDPNRNGTWGADGTGTHGGVVVRGSLEASYLWGRITGTVPGSRMPLANAPLTDVEYVAMACWIETLDANPSAEDPIDYDACEFAKNPVSYESM